MAKHSRGLHPNSIPPRFHRVFDSVGSHIFAVSVRIPPSLLTHELETRTRAVILPW